MNKKELALEVIERLKNEYPDADCTLEYDQAWKLLVSVRLAAQCTDARVNVVVKGLFEKYPTVEALAAADVADYGRSFHQKKEVISATGWYGMEEMSVRQEQSLIVRDVV